MAGHRSPTLPEKRCGGATRGSAARREPSSGLTYTPKRCSGTSLGLCQAGPAYTPDSATKNLEKFDAQPRVEPTASVALLSDRSHVSPSCGWTFACHTLRHASKVSERALESNSRRYEVTLDV